MRKRLRRMLIIVLLCVLIGCSRESTTSKLLINGKDSGVPNVFFHEDYVALPCISTLLSMGGEYCGQADQSKIQILLQNTIFCYDVEKQQLSVKENAEDTAAGESAEERIVLPLPDGQDSAFVNWTVAEIMLDHNTFQKLLDDAGIRAQISVDFQKERIAVETD